MFISVLEYLHIKQLQMKYQPVTAVWEVTMGCNMNCKHCGSSCQQPLIDELTTNEALAVINEMSQMGLKWITLSGGEPLIRKDLPLLIKQLKKVGITTNVITNGWLLKEKAAMLKEAGVDTVAVSIDGTEQIHDSIRKPRSYQHDKEGILALRKLGVEVGAITTLSKRNINILSQLKEELIEMGVRSWQVQIGLPMGNMAAHKEWVLDPVQMNDIIDFCFQTSREGRIKIFPADCIGYYDLKEQEVRQASYQTSNTLWDGCNAGIRGFGLLHNGDIIGCTSVRDRQFIEGNLRERSLSDIWNDEQSFAWRRGMKKEQLSGNCKRCIYGSRCLGGCTNTRLTTQNTIYGENHYCTYNNYLKALSRKIGEQIDSKQLFYDAQIAVQKGDLQEAALMTEKVISLEPECIDAYLLKGYAEYMCGNYSKAKEENKTALSLAPNNPYAMKGLALSLHKLKEVPLKEVVDILEKANELSGYSDTDLISDLNIIKQEYLASK